jgi:hypothetical protein
LDENATLTDMLEDAFDNAHETELPTVANILYERSESLDE